jgi:dTDP-4-dehydrorhamnose 3,5-epimerase
MEIIETGFKNLSIIKPNIFMDSRGYFYESYNRRILHNLGITSTFVQDNQSESSYGVIRGLHYQINPHAQAKLVRVLHGEIYDVAVDLRAGSPTHGKYYGIVLSSLNNLQLFIPHGFAHGFAVLSPKAVVLYKTDEFYHKESERGIVYNDQALNINWQISPSKVTVSDRDMNLPVFGEHEANFIF